MIRWLVPPKALILGIVLSIPGFVLGLALGGWVAPVVIALLRSDLAALTQMPRSMWILPAAPTWYTSTEHVIWNVSSFAAIVLGGFSMHWALKLWKYLVVVKFKWMSDEEVQAFHDRDPGG